jgi:RNA polymerase sigma-70 factor (ECF subfamily)
LSPYPDALLDELEAPAGDPVAAYDLRESVQLAFLAAGHVLPPRQRAVLILHDVVGFSVGEVADVLEATTASVHCALTRARATLAQQRAAGRLPTGRIVPTDEVTQSLVRRYVAAWQAVDIGKLVGLLKSDVVMTMPPLPMRYTGRSAVTEFLATIPARGERDRLRFNPTRANRQPALALYRAAAPPRRPALATVAGRIGGAMSWTLVDGGSASASMVWSGSALQGVIGHWSPPLTST